MSQGLKLTAPLVRKGHVDGTRGPEVDRCLGARGRRADSAELAEPCSSSSSLRTCPRLAYWPPFPPMSPVQLTNSDPSQALRAPPRTLQSLGPMLFSARLLVSAVISVPPYAPHPRRWAYEMSPLPPQPTLPICSGFSLLRPHLYTRSVAQ